MQTIEDPEVAAPDEPVAPSRVISAASWCRAAVRRHRWFLLVLLIGGVFVHRAWFSGGILAGADWHYQSRDAMRGFVHFPYAWDSSTGLGQANDVLPLFLYYQLGFGLLSAMG